MRAVAISLLVAVAAGCAVYAGQKYDELYGAADPARYDQPSPASAALTTAPGAVPDYQRDVKPILDNRCVVCHGCYDAPCQLNLASFEGIARGAHKQLVYDSARLAASDPTRLFVDAQSSVAWRAKGFHAVLNERAATPEANREASVLYRSLRLRRAHPLPEGPVLPKERFDFSLDRAQHCPAIEAMDAFEQKVPDQGMPFGLPNLSDREYATLTRWIEAGAPHGEPAPLPGAYLQRIIAWEQFLNGDSLKTRLMARYVYEHWFIGHLYFDDLPGREYFELVRSRTPPGQPIDLVATRRPYDDPGVERVYYRLRRVTDAVLAKTHMPYALNAARMSRFKAWFLDAPYEVKALPSYVAEVASNPFVAFREVPINARYRFMLEEAQFTLMGFIKGPVCRGQVALGVINDHFWVVFVKPELSQSEVNEEFLAKERGNLRLPAESAGGVGRVRWLRYAASENDYLKAKARYLRERLGKDNPPTLAMLWDGDRANPNAGLTIFRHFDSASVLQGLLGDQPQTAWVIGYPLLERIHYLLVAGFDVYGSTGHQLSTRLYMDFLRMEGELNFLPFLPRAVRQPVRDRWYRNAGEQQIGHFKNVDSIYAEETGIPFKTAEPLTEMYGLLKAHVAPVSKARHEIASSGLGSAAKAVLVDLSKARGRAVARFPEMAFLTVRDGASGDHHFTLISNNAHSNVAEMFDENRRRLPGEDTLTVLNGFAGSYPNAFFRVEAAELPGFADALRGLSTEEDYRKFHARYGIGRTDERFWQHSDALAEAYRKSAPVEAGLFDYSRFENR